MTQLERHSTTNSDLKLDRRSLLQNAGAFFVAFSIYDVNAQQRNLPELGPGKTLKLDEVDAFLALTPDGSVTVYCGKVDLGTGLRIAIPQMVAEELDVPLSAIKLIEGDTALTPDQGPTAGSSGIMRGGVQIRQAAATARETLLGLAAQHWNVSKDGLICHEGNIVNK